MGTFQAVIPARRIGVVIALVASVLIATPPAAIADHVPILSIDGGAHPATVGPHTWEIAGSTGYPGVLGMSGRVQSLSLHGNTTQQIGDCTWSGLSTDSGMVEILIYSPNETRSYVLFDVVIDMSLNGLWMEMYGQWNDAAGRLGTFAAYGFVDEDPEYAGCHVFFDAWAFGNANYQPSELIEFLLSQSPENAVPNAPSLIAPSEGFTFQPTQLQRFSVQASDPDDDPYVGLIFVDRPTTPSGQFDDPWPTASAASGGVAEGIAPVRYPQGSGYMWKAQASDGRASSDFSAEVRSFNVS